MDIIELSLEECALLPALEPMDAAEFNQPLTYL